MLLLLMMLNIITINRAGQFSSFYRSRAHLAESLCYYRTLVGSGLKNKTDLRKPLASLIPPHIAHHSQNVAKFEPEGNAVITSDGVKLTYDTLIVAPGLKVNFDGIENLSKALADSSSGVSSIYSYETADKAWFDIEDLRHGKAIFTQPAGVIKCAGAPQKIMWQAWDRWKSTDRGKNIQIEFVSGMPTMFSVPK